MIEKLLRAIARSSKPDFATMEQAFLRIYEVALTGSNSLVMRPIRTGSFRVIKTLDVARFVRSFLLGRNESQLWRRDLTDDFCEWLRANADEVEPGTLVRAAGGKS